MTQTQHDAAVKRIRDGGGTWPPRAAAPVPPWRDTGRWHPALPRLRSTVRPIARRWCEVCSGVLP